MSANAQQWLVTLNPTADAPSNRAFKSEAKIRLGKIPFIYKFIHDLKTI